MGLHIRSFIILFQKSLLHSLITEFKDEMVAIVSGTDINSPNVQTHGANHPYTWILRLLSGYR